MGGKVSQSVSRSVLRTSFGSTPKPKYVLRSNEACCCCPRLGSAMPGPAKVNPPSVRLES